MWCERKCGSDILVHAKFARGKTHDCLGMNLDRSYTGKLKVDMRHCTRSMEKEWSCEIKKENEPWNGIMFKADKNSKLLSEEAVKLFHRFAMKNMFYASELILTLKFALVSYLVVPESRRTKILEDFDE